MRIFAESVASTAQPYMHVGYTAAVSSKLGPHVLLIAVSIAVMAFVIGREKTSARPRFLRFSKRLLAALIGMLIALITVIIIGL